MRFAKRLLPIRLSTPQHRYDDTAGLVLSEVLAGCYRIGPGPMRSLLPHRTLIVAGVFLIGFIAVTAAAGQRRATTQIWNGGFGFTEPPRLPTSTTFTGGFNFSRLAIHRQR